jgi:alkylhydroperoxidase/carboxymuconolactone decarboxylase family protein YurZ
MDAMEALDRLADEIDLAVDRARKAGLTDKEIAECLRDIAANAARGMP